MSRRVWICWLACWVMAGDLAAWGQGAAPPATTPLAPAVPNQRATPPSTSGNSPPAPAAPTTSGAGDGLSPLPPRANFSSGGATLGTPTYDAYNSGSNPGVFTPALPNQPALGPDAASGLGSLFGGFSGGAAGASTGYQTVTPPPAMPPQSSYPPAGAAGGYGYPDSVYPNATPPVLLPGGTFGGGYATAPGNYYNPFAEFAMPGAFKFLQGPRLRHGWLGGGDDPSDLGMHETDVSVAFAFPNFLWSGQPIYVLPSFSLDLWQGPSAGLSDLPGSAYGGFLDFGWQTDPNQILGLETGARIGAFTDFDTFNSDSMRYMGQLLGKIRLTPRMTAKLGVMYIDRLRVKLIPAGGLLWQPSPYSRWDIYFPEPKIAHYLSTIGRHDVWWYVAGEYGGGSWTVTRQGGFEDQVDINDFRLLGGFEWGRSDLIRSGRRTGFIEAGWVFGREVVYGSGLGNMDPDSTFVLRAGFGY